MQARVKGNSKLQLGEPEKKGDARLDSLGQKAALMILGGCQYQILPAPRCAAGTDIRFSVSTSSFASARRDNRAAECQGGKTCRMPRPIPAPLLHHQPSPDMRLSVLPNSSAPNLVGSRLHSTNTLEQHILTKYQHTIKAFLLHHQQQSQQQSQHTNQTPFRSDYEFTKSTRIKAPKLRPGIESSRMEGLGPPLPPHTATAANLWTVGISNSAGRTFSK